MRAMRAGLLVTLVVGLPVALGACGTTKGAGDPTGVEWLLITSSADDLDLGSAGITAEFKDGRIAGFSGINQYSGPYATDTTGALESGPFVTTLMAGPEPLMNAERAYLELLDGCDSFRVEDGKLTLSTGGKTTLTFEAAPSAELPGSSWVVTGYNNGKEAVVSVSADATLTLDFGSDGTVSGNAGVNRYTGPFESTGDTVAIGPLATTKMAGPEALMTQEALFLPALEQSATWSIRQGRLELRDNGGATQVNCVRAP